KTATVTITSGGSSQSFSCANSVSISGTPDLTAGSVSPTSATTGVSASLSGAISNGGSASAGASNSYIRINNAANGGGTKIYEASTGPGAIAASGSTSAGFSYTFPSAGTYSAQICADWFGEVAESNEGNNCGAWTNITVANASLPDLTASIASPS